MACYRQAHSVWPTNWLSSPPRVSFRDPSSRGGCFWGKGDALAVVPLVKCVYGRPSAARLGKASSTKGRLCALRLEFGNGGGINGPGNTGGSGGGRDDSQGNGGFFNPFVFIAQGLQSRMAADADFAFKLFVECGLDAAIIICVNMGARGERFFSEFEFVMCQVLVSLLNDFALVYLLAPCLRKTVARPGSLQAMLSKLPSHFFQRSTKGQLPFTVQQRLGCLAVKAMQYGTVGFSMGIIGTSLVHALTHIREKVDPNFVPPASMQSVLGTGVGWLYFMSVSSNVRYNIVNAAEDALYLRFPGAVSKTGSVGLRLANNFIGACSWVRLSKQLKLDQPRTG